MHNTATTILSVSNSCACFFFVFFLSLALSLSIPFAEWFLHAIAYTSTLSCVISPHSPPYLQCVSTSLDAIYDNPYPSATPCAELSTTGRHVCNCHHSKIAHSLALVFFVSPSCVWSGGREYEVVELWVGGEGVDGEGG